VATHFSRLLRHAWVTVGLFLFPGHHTGIQIVTSLHQWLKSSHFIRFCIILQLIQYQWKLKIRLNNKIQHDPYWKFDSSSAGQDILFLYGTRPWKTVTGPYHESIELSPEPHATFFKNHFHIFLPTRLTTPNWFLPFGLTIKVLYAFLISLYTRAVWKVLGLAVVRHCYASLCITAAYFRQSTNFSNGLRSCSAILKKGSLKRP
jgi:hypothetical protein